MLRYASEPLLYRPFWRSNYQRSTSQMRDYYAEFSRLTKILAHSAWQLDRMSVLRSRACLFSTEWAARSAIRDYGADPSRVHVIPWGANVDHPREVCSDDRAIPSNVCNLVFIGVDWERKGGAIAVAAAMRLSAAGHAVKLHIIGATPDLTQQSDTIIILGFVNKSTEDGRLKFDRIMRQAAFLFVPTRQDCSPMVFAERLRKSSLTRFDSVLNWNSWLFAAAPVIQAAVAPAR